ncbi:MAG: hypothetical protein EXR79_03770 [Myxococcales bacterium]|nr:hypothetical protein [Myxococcales bacterium]
MTPALIDLHVKPVLNEIGHHDIELIAVQARDRGIDGVVVIAANEAVNLGDTREVSAATGVHLFAGVEVETESGRLLCYPRTIDDWFLCEEWRSVEHTNGAGPTRYDSAGIVRAFTERGGAVVGVPLRTDAEGIGPLVPGVSALLVTDGASGVDDRAVRVAFENRVACVGGSVGVPGDDRFGAVATVFAAPPTSQESMVEGLRSGRVWPAEIGASWAVAAPVARKPERPRADLKSDARGDDRRDVARAEVRTDGRDGVRPDGRTDGRTDGRDSVRPDGRTDGRGNELADAAPRPPFSRAVREPPRPSRYDGFDRPGDNRGNRLNRDELQRRIPMAVPDDGQPSIDPIAVMYGVERRAHRLQRMSDDELDRINGNRARGPDPNVMAMPSFEELRPDRGNLQALLGRADEEDGDVADSVSLRFALAHYNQTLGQLSLQHLPGGGRPQRNGGRRRRH